jgi:hypothetical protein
MGAGKVAQPETKRSVAEGGEIQTREAAGADFAAEENSNRTRRTEETETPRFREVSK